MSQIEAITPEQEALIPVYVEKWRAIALSRQPINRAQATEAVNAAYALIGVKEPDIIFCDSPNSINQQIDFLNTQLGNPLAGKLEGCLYREQDHQVTAQMSPDLDDRLYELVHLQLFSQLNAQLGWQLYSPLKKYSCICPEFWAGYGSWLDFCIHVLNCAYEPNKWDVFQRLVQTSGCLLPYQNICLVCDRPRILCFDNQQRLHGEGTPAIQFPDGFSVYAYHGVRLPEKYGKLYPQEWQAEWLLAEENAELRRVLIQGIGWDDICQKLPATQLDSWQDYTAIAKY